MNFTVDNEVSSRVTLEFIKMNIIIVMYPTARRAGDYDRIIR